jgi:hypothetical protein
MRTPINAHFYIYIKDVQRKVTKPNALLVDLITFACRLNQNNQGETQFVFQSIVVSDQQKLLSLLLAHWT